MSTPAESASDLLRLEGMRFLGHHGATAAEREAGVLIEVDLEVRTETRTASGSDRLEDAVDYTQLVEVCRRVVEESECHLLESVAERVAGAVLDESRIASVVVRVGKRPPLRTAVERFSVTIERHPG